MLPRGPLDIAISILNIKAVGLMVRFRDLCFPHNKSNGGDIDPQGVASLDPRGLCCGALDVATY